ncbi:MAG TPA: type II toxin-antitoxin system VapC family toxin [Mycobacteriales bacterium]|nr:type II toxin-antitoxin system VapC family toxin [Mycobacteriales bacterium]
MRLADVNILVTAFRDSAPGHKVCRDLVEEMVNGTLPYGVSELVLSGFLRVATHPRVFDPPAPLSAALAFADAYRSGQAAVMVSPGPRHWPIFTALCRSARAKGGLVPDAYLAALAIESGCEWVSADRDFARFPDLRWTAVDLG